MSEAENLTEAKAGALADRLGREERLECALDHFGGHARPGIGHRHADIVARLDIADGVGAERDVARRDDQLADPLHRVARIDRQVDDRVFQLMGIDESRPRLGVEPGLDDDPLAQCAVEQIRHASDQRTAVDPFGQERLGAGEGKQAAGQRGGAGGALHRVVEVDHDLASRAVETAAGEIDPANDDRQHVVEIMRDATGQLTNGFHLLDLAELGFGRLAIDRLGLERLVGKAEFAGAILDRCLER